MKYINSAILILTTILMYLRTDQVFLYMALGVILLTLAGIYQIKFKHADMDKVRKMQLGFCNILFVIAFLLLLLH